MIWFTADYHFGHANIIKYCNRPFSSVEEMNNTIITNHNSLVRPEDTVYFLGDFHLYLPSAMYYLSLLNGTYVFIRGNHDRTSKFVRKNSVKRLILEYNNNVILLIHNSLTIDETDKFDYCFTAHSHEKWRRKGNFINVGVDCHNFRPITFEQAVSCE